MNTNTPDQPENGTSPETLSPDVLSEKHELARQKHYVKKSEKTLFILLALGFVMFGFAFANVPLFGMLCSAIGIEMNPGEKTVSTEITGRELPVYFMGNVSAGIPITTEPVKRSQNVLLGDATINDYKFRNLSDRTIYFRPVHSIQPSLSADYFLLEECFCFDLQKIEPKQKLSLPVVYRIGSDIPDTVHNMTLNYTMFEVTKQEYEKYWEGQKNKKKEESATVAATKKQMEEDAKFVEKQDISSNSN